MQEIILSDQQIQWCQAALAHIAGSNPVDATRTADAKPNLSDTASAPESNIINIAPLQVEASHRRFYRLECQDKTQNQPITSWIFMDSPPELENNNAFVELSQVFLDAGLNVPIIVAKELERGWLLTTDLGTQHLADLYGSHEEDLALTSAIATLKNFRLIKPDQVPTYSAQRMRDELHIFTEWLLEKYCGITLGEGQQQGLKQAFEQLVSATQEQPQCCVHRDYHCRNLLMHNNKLGIVDFQDALFGPALYDVASLLRDCYYTFPETVVRSYLDQFVAEHNELSRIDGDIVWRWFNFTAIQRQLKAIGIFARLHLRDDKSSHLAHVEPVIQRLLELLKQYPELQEIEVQLKNCIKHLPSASAGSTPSSTTTSTPTSTTASPPTSSQHQSTLDNNQPPSEARGK